MPITGTPVTGGTFSGWLTSVEADTYFETRLNATPFTSATDAVKAAALTTAQGDLVASPDFTFIATDLAAPAQAMKDAVCEQALFLLLDPDMALRQNMRAQGVTGAGIVIETYRRGKPGGALIAPKCYDLLAAYVSARNKARSHSLKRAEAPADE